MPNIALSEKIVMVLNPCPDVDEKELYDRAGVYSTRPLHGKAFKVEYKWSTGAEREWLNVAPGEMKQVPLSIARDIVKSLKHRGMVMVDPDASEEDIGQIEQRGLREALMFWTNRGSEQLRVLRARNNFTDDDMEQSRQRFAPYFVNIERAKEIEEALKKVAEKRSNGARKTTLE